MSRQREAGGKNRRKQKKKDKHRQTGNQADRHFGFLRKVL